MRTLQVDTLAGGVRAQRTLSQVFKNCEGYLPRINGHTPEDEALFAHVDRVIHAEMPAAYADLAFAQALEAWMGAVFACNAYIDAHDIPVNPLHAQGFVSIGCAPCTRAIEPGEDPRAGRWWWETEDKKECGLHVAETERRPLEAAAQKEVAA